MINDYKIPGGKGGLAVRIACDLIVKNPGIKQGDLLQKAASIADLNTSTAGWITSPSDKSPAEKLWTRKKEGRGYRLYPNEWTPGVAETAPQAYLDSIKESVEKANNRLTNSLGRPLRQGDLIRFQKTGGTSACLGFKVVREDALRSFDEISSSPNEAFRVWNEKIDVHTDSFHHYKLVVCFLTHENQLIQFIDGHIHADAIVINDPPTVWKVRVAKRHEVSEWHVYELGTCLFEGGYFLESDYYTYSDRTSWKTKSKAEAALESFLNKKSTYCLPRDIFEIVCI